MGFFGSIADTVTDAAGGVVDFATDQVASGLGQIGVGGAEDVVNTVGDTADSIISGKSRDARNDAISDRQTVVKQPVIAPGGITSPETRQAQQSSPEPALNSGKSDAPSGGDGGPSPLVYIALAAGAYLLLR
jgi:hypothetical protein